MDTIDRSLSEEQRMMRASCRAFINDFVTPFIRQNWQKEWLMDPDARLPRSILEQAAAQGDGDLCGGEGERRAPDALGPARCEPSAQGDAEHERGEHE